MIFGIDGSPGSTSQRKPSPRSDTERYLPYLMEREVIQEESRLASDDLLNDDETGIPPGEVIDPDRKKRLNTPGVVKEVSDGDEESDDDDTTTES